MSLATALIKRCIVRGLIAQRSTALWLTSASSAASAARSTSTVAGLKMVANAHALSPMDASKVFLFLLL